MLKIFLFSVVIALCESQECNDVNPCPEGFSCHPAQNICYTDPPQTSKLHVWLGEGPDECNRQPSDCVIFMMDYDTSHVYGGLGEWCNTGVKIRCVVKDAPPLNPPTPANELRVISYNIFERGYPASIDGQRERTCRIPHVFAAMYPDVDVIAFQECLMGGCWPDQLSIRDLLTYIGFPYHTQTLKSPNKISNGGIFIASRWPIVEEDQYIYSSSDKLSWDTFAAKGVAYAKIIKESRVYHIMGTHVQAGSGDRATEAKFNQSIEWADYATSKNIPADEGVIFTGDFNANYYDGPGGLFEAMMNNLDAGMTQLVGPINASSSNAVINDIQKLKGKEGWGKWIDHAVYSQRHLIPVTATVEIIEPKDPEPFPVCWCEKCINPLRWSYIYPTPDDCTDPIEHIQDLADHQPVLGTFIFQ